MEFPASAKDIKRFQNRNQISINILAIMGRQIYICRKGGNYENALNLMIITEGEQKHYVAIKPISRLLSKKNSKRNGKQYFCKDFGKRMPETNTQFIVKTMRQ